MDKDNIQQCIAFELHDHSQCQNQLMRQAKALCENRRVKLTPRRLQVLTLLTQSHQPMGAYEILGCLNQQVNDEVFKKSQSIAPPIVYRALEFLLAEGLVHRIESKNAFISCDHPGHQYAAQFLICSGCEKVAELDNPDSSLLAEAGSLGFKVDRSVVEITGVCRGCSKMNGNDDET
jgi:Fur family zinc uptake transcriptional regulator